MLAAPTARAEIDGHGPDAWRVNGVGADDHLNARMRLHRVETLLECGHGHHDADSLFPVLRDHSNYPKSVCKHHDVEVNPDVQTVASVVVDLDAGLLHVRPGHPCDTETTTVALG